MLIGMMNGTAPVDISYLCANSISIDSIWRYKNCFDRAISMVSSGKIDIKRFISKTYKFDDAVAAYEFAAEGHPEVVKVMIEL